MLLELNDIFAQDCREANAAVKAARAAMQTATPFQINACLGAIIKANNEQATLAAELIKLLGTDAPKQAARYRRAEKRKLARLLG
jgi:hypothetical protein